MTTSALVDYDFAVLRAVPRVQVGTFVNVGVLVHARTAEYLVLRAITDEAELSDRVHGADAGMLARYLRACIAICAGDGSAGPVALAPSSERFHWLTAPRSDMLQASAVHEGICADPAAIADELFASYVLNG